MVKYLGIIRCHVNNLYSSNSEGGVFVRYVQLFCKFEIISKFKILYLYTMI